MGVLNRLFSKKEKKKTFRALCHLSKEPIEKGSSYYITTAELISSRRFWDNIMTEPETMSYSISHFKNQDETGTHMRRIIFEKYSREDKPWIISEAQMHQFDVDRGLAMERANEWWDKEGKYAATDINPSLNSLGEQNLNEIRDYAVMEAGRKKVTISG